MSDRRKDMWKLLYSLVNRNETQLDDVFVFVDDILCKEPSLIRYSVKESTNRFQDTFILWLVNKLVKSLKVEIGQDYETHEKNLKIQRKLLNSCLVNRSVLFEILIHGYVAAIDELCEEYAKADLTPQVENEDQLLKITAFTSDDDCLKEIDPDFSFPAIEVGIDDVDEYIRALLQILHHGLFVGYTHYSMVFENSLLTVLKVLKECEFLTKLNCLQYLGRVFEKVSSLNCHLQNMYDLTFRALTLMWNYMPMWLNNNCFPLEAFDDFIEESINLLKILKHLQNQASYKEVIISHCFLLMQYIYEIHQWQRFRLGQTPHNLGEVFKALAELIFQLNHSSKVKEKDESYYNVIWRVAEEYPFVLRILPAFLEERKIETFFKMVEIKILDYLKLEAFEKSQFEIATESLNCLILWEHQQRHYLQLKSLKDLNYETQNLLELAALDIQMKPGFKNLLKPLEDWCAKRNSSVAETTTDTHDIILAGVLLQSKVLRAQLTDQLQAKLLDIVLKPTKNLKIGTNNLELSLQLLSQIDCLNNESAINNVRSILKAVEKHIFIANQDNLMLKFSFHLPLFVVKEWLTMEFILKEFHLPSLKNPVVYKNLLKLFCCYNNESTEIVQIKKFIFNENICNTSCQEMLQVEAVCRKCFNSLRNNSDLDLKQYLEINLAVLQVTKINSMSSANRKLPPQLKSKFIEELFTNQDFHNITNHLDYSQLTAEEALNFIFSSSMDITKLYLPTVSAVVAIFLQNDSEFVHKLSAAVLQKVVESLKPNEMVEHQKTILEIIDCCTQHNGLLTEHWLFHFFKMTFFYLLHPESQVTHEAILTACEMCSANNVQPIQLWNWYKRDALNLVVKLIVYVYLSRGVRMTRSLKAFTKMLGFSCVQEFICKYYRLLVTMILPYCVKEPLCKGLIVSISKITRKPVSSLFVVSFLRIYTHIYLTEDAEIGNACIEFIGKCTGASLSKLMNTDVKQTVSEFLVYFNRSPTFVMQAFQCLLPNEVGATTSAVRKTTKNSSQEFANFINDRFLGVITYFQTCLAEPNFEKPLKEETLCSLGQIMRLIGPNNVTQFRFKIIAMLSFVLTLNDRNLQNICLKVWNIFLHVVNTEELGPSLSRIVASLQPLMATNPQEINDIYEYLILKNDSLLGVYIPDLYFLENIPEVKPNIRQYVARQTEILDIERNGVADRLAFLYKQVCNENLQVRIYGLNHMRTFISKNRVEINHMILDTIPVDPLIEQIVDELMKGCRHDDRNMNLASAKCLGELGAIDPSYMSANFSFMNTTEISLSIHTDDFAIMALTELCKAYQFQKDTKYVDNFSLAIQETLSVFGVSPKEHKKLNVWEALPTRMQQVMEPLLTSCYTGSRRESKFTEHPLFESSLCRSYEDWSFAWACRLIEMVNTDETRHLMNSYKPSIKRDTNMLAVFFPYILLHALQECPSEKVQQIYEEFMAVFNFCSCDNFNQQEMDVTGYKEFKSTKYAAERMPSETVNSHDHFETSETLTQTCTKLCSEQIDFLQRWLREWQKLNMVNGKLTQTDNRFKIIDDFVKKFNKALISKANYNSGEYARALMYLEEYIEEQPAIRLQEQLSYLIEIHGKLMDSDSVEGAVYMKKSNLSLEEEILVNRLIDKPEETITCYEQLLSKEDQTINQDHIKGMINCYLRLDNPETALLITDGLWQKLADQYTDDYFKECKSELLWRLGRYDELQELLEDSVVKRKTTNWNIQCAESFLLFRQPNDTQQLMFENFLEQLDVIRSNVVSSMRSCSVVTGNSYTHSYDEVIRLHLLNELEDNKKLLNYVKKYSSTQEQINQNAEQCLGEVQNFFKNWDSRLDVLQPIARVLEPVLCFRRNLLLETQRILHQDLEASNNLIEKVNAKINGHLVKLWLRTIHMNRESGCLQQAQISIMKAEQYKPVTLFLEKAKLLWQKGDQTNCFKLLEENIKVLERNCEGDLRKLDISSRHLYAEAKFLQASYNAESMNICSELNLRYFKEAVAGNRTSEKYLVHYSQYMEKIYDSLTREQKDSDNGCRLLLDIMLHYAKSLKYGYANVYQSLPRLLSIWLDFTSQLVSMVDSNSNQASDSGQANKIPLFQELAKKMNDMINNCVNMLPTSIFYTAFSQLLSRICHPSPDVFNNLRNIFIKLIEHFPQQSLWMLLPIFKSCHNSRMKRCRLIFTDARLNNAGFQKLLNDFNMLAERLIELTDKEVSFDRTYELSSLVRQLPRLFEDSNFSKIMLPFEKFMQPSFPITSTAEYLNLNTSASSDSGGNSSSMPSSPFPSCCVYLCGIREEIVVLRSAAKPKKITFECSDGLSYNVMVKPKDDLRKDFRLMEFNGLVKRYLHQDSKARHRRLRIRTYAAIPFNEECGLVEWLPNLNSFRGICVSMYRMRGLGIPDRALRQCALPKTDPIEKKREMFTNVLLARHPPIFNEWFKQRFPSPHSWYQARSSYVKTIAVMSMVGYILGLGDRHGENILFDETNGDAVHVDFNCLFNQGESFAYPEIVPFRLTHNMVFAMGPLGVEGLFRKCCEITLRVLKDESKTLMSVLRPFVYDLGSINRLKGKTPTGLEITDPKAITDVKRIEERLQGYVKRSLGNSMPLSTEGQVNFLINEATDINNLASMYIGWGSYI